MIYSLFFPTRIGVQSLKGLSTQDILLKRLSLSATNYKRQRLLLSQGTKGRVAFVATRTTWTAVSGIKSNLSALQPYTLLGKLYTKESYSWHTLPPEPKRPNKYNVSSLVLFFNFKDIVTSYITFHLIHRNFTKTDS